MGRFGGNHRRTSFHGFRCPSFLRPLPNRPIHLLVERRAPRRKLPQFIVLRAHERGAIAERATNVLAVESSRFLKLTREVRLWQRRTADAYERDTAITYVGRARMKKKLLQVTVAAADHRQHREFLLQLG